MTVENIKNDDKNVNYEESIESINLNNKKCEKNIGTNYNIDEVDLEKGWEYDYEESLYNVDGKINNEKNNKFSLSKRFKNNNSDLSNPKAIKKQYKYKSEKLYVNILYLSDHEYYKSSSLDDDLNLSLNIELTFSNNFMPYFNVD